MIAIALSIIGILFFASSDGIVLLRMIVGGGLILLSHIFPFLILIWWVAITH